MTDVYLSVPTDANDPCSKMDRLKTARRALLGEADFLVTCTGVDSMYNACRPETRRCWKSWIVTFLSVICTLFIGFYVYTTIHHVHGLMSWTWAEWLIIAFLAVHALVSAICIIIWTSGDYFLNFYEQWREAATLAANYHPSESNGKCHSSSRAFAPPSGKRPVFIVLGAALFLGATIAGGYKFAVQNGHGPGNANATASGDINVHQIYNGELLSAVWAAFISLVAVTIHCSLHAAVEGQVHALNEHMKEARDEEQLEARLEYFARRQTAVVNVAYTLAANSHIFSTISAVAGIIGNAAAMYVTLVFKEELSGLSHACILLWTFFPISLIFVSSMIPSKLQKALSENTAIILSDKRIWTAPGQTPQLAQSMVSRVQDTNTSVTLLDCIRVTAYTGNKMMLFAPLLGLGLILLREVLNHHKS